MNSQQGQEYNNYKQRLTNFSNEFDLGLFVYIVKKTFVWVLLSVIVAGLAALLYLRYTPRVYQANTVIQLGEDEYSKSIININQFGDDNSIQSRLELLRSNMMIRQTVQKMPLEIGYFAEGEILTNEHYLLSPYEVEIIELRNENVRNIPIHITFQNERTYSIQYRGKEVSGLLMDQVAELEEMDILVHIKNWKSVTSLSQEYELFFRLNSLSALVKRFSRNLNVRILNSTAKTLGISYQDNNTHLARDFAQTHAQEFIRFDLERRSRSDENIISFIDNQVDTVFDNLRASETLLNEYKQQNKITNLESISGVYLERLTEYEDEIVSLEIEERLLKEVGNLAAGSTDDIEIYNLVPLVAGSKFESSLKGLLDNLYNLLLTKEEALYSITPDNNRIANLEYQIGIQEKLAVETIQALKNKTTERKESLQNELESVSGLYFALPQKELEFARLRRLLNINEKYYTMLLEKRIEYRISKEGFVTRHQVLEEASLPRQPISPKPRVITVAFLLAGAFFGFLVVSIRYLVHNDITSLNEIVKLSDASMGTLGIVPKYKSLIPDSMMIVDKHPKSLIAEAFRSVRTNLQFIDNTDGPKLAAITSTISGEGKTFIAINLAGIIAFSGKKVIVIDLDMRKPKIHKGMRTDNSFGM
ncbi:MAG: tyrosine-protein kinase Etk/Wzc, partial [Flavobacteriales bacterium]